MQKSKHLIVIVGPTAAGKTAISIELAKHYQCEILSADSRQFYKEITIGTAKPSAEEMDGIPHHFVGHLSIHDHYTAGKFETDAIAKLTEIYQTQDVAILVGGSGLFIDAVCKGLDEIPSNPTIKAQLEEELIAKGLPFLQEELQEKDPEFYANSDTKNPHRILRALEVIRTSGNTFTSYRNNKPKNREFQIHTIGINLDREILYQRINQRVDVMLEAGLMNEINQLITHKNLNTLKTVGYQEYFTAITNKSSLEEATNMVKQNSRRYAKRQITWFKRNPETKWFSPLQSDEILSHLKEFLKFI